VRKLLVIGCKSEADDVLDEVASKLGSGNGMDFCVRRCVSPGKLPAIVAAVARQSGPIEILELFDHGNRGLIYMGNDVLFSSTDAPGGTSPKLGDCTQAILLVVWGGSSAPLGL
jgi:hypothetical protein